MVHLIDKFALVAEIEKLKENARMSYSDYADGRLDVCKELLSFIDTLEVKEVDMEREINDYFITVDLCESEKITENTFRRIAKHFFELGMSVSNKAQKGD